MPVPVEVDSLASHLLIFKRDEAKPFDHVSTCSVIKWKSNTHDFTTVSEQIFHFLLGWFQWKPFDNDRVFAGASHQFCNFAFRQQGVVQSINIFQSGKLLLNISGLIL